MLVTAGIMLIFTEDISVWVLMLFIFEIVLVLGLFEKIGGRVSNICIIDTRSQDAEWPPSGGHFYDIGN